MDSFGNTSVLNMVTASSRLPNPFNEQACSNKRDLTGIDLEIVIPNPAFLWRLISRVSFVEELTQFLCGNKTLFIKFDFKKIFRLDPNFIKRSESEILFVLRNHPVKCKFQEIKPHTLQHIHRAHNSVS